MKVVFSLLPTPYYASRLGRADPLRALAPLLPTYHLSVNLETV
jgi:hypothetical protein